MNYTPPKYPTAIPTIEDLPDRIDFVDWQVAARYNELKKELRAALIELGTLPKGSYADVKTRLDAMVAGFTDRGDPASFDWTLVDFTTDLTWRELDLSAIVPAGVKAVLFVMQIEDNAVNTFLQFREKGNVNERNYSLIRTQVANIPMVEDWVVACDADRKIEYRGTNTAFSSIFCMVRGWWM